MQTIVKIGYLFLGAAVIGGTIATDAFAGGQVSQQGDVTVFTQSNGGAASVIDFEKAKPMPLPSVDSAPVGPDEGSTRQEGTPGFEPGSHGNGKMSPVVIPRSSVGETSEDEFSSQEYGTANHPYTTMRVDNTNSNAVSKTYPFRAAGKLYYNDSDSSYVCSASLIKTGVAVTAAHCVAEFGESRFFSDWRYVPALYKTTAPYGQWYVTEARILTSYYNGTDPCYQSGVVCENDVAVLVITPQNNAYPGTTTGCLGYGWNGYGFTDTGNLALINQLGYPASHDSGTKMQRTDSQGFVSSTMSGNTIWGSRQTGGSSGGPEVVNLGTKPVLSGDTFGS